MTSGTPDAAVRRGCFYRVVNPLKPELNSREGAGPPRQDGGLATPDPEAWWVTEHAGSGWDW